MLFGTLPHIFTLLRRFFRMFPPGLFLCTKGFYYCFSSKRRKETKTEQKEKDQTILHVSCCTLVLLCWPGPSAEMCRGFLLWINFGRFSRGFSWRIFLGTFSHKNEEKKSGEKIREKKIRRLKNKNPRKIRSATDRP